MKNRPLQFIWYNFILTMIFLIILFSMQDLYGMTFINNGLAVLYSFTILCLFLSEWNKYFYLLFLFLWFHPAIRWRFFEALRDFVPLVISMVINQGLIEEYNKAFLNIVFILFVPTYLIFYYNIKVKKRTVFLFIIGFILFYTQYYFGSLKINRAILYFTFTLILYGYNNFTKNVEKANINSNLQKGYLIRWITLITIFVMGTNLFIKLLPFKNEPLIKGGENLSNYFNFQPRSFSLSMTGYQRDGSRLGGPIKDDYSVAMIVTTNEDLGEIHLRGSIKTVYNGSKWVKLDNLKEYKITSEVNDISGLNRAKKLNIKLRNISYEIKPQKINTETLFSPLYLDYIKIASNKEIFMDEDGEIYSSENLNTNDVYYVQSLYYDYNNLEEYIKKASKNTSQMNKEKYLQIPPNVPERVLNLSKDLIKPYQDRTNLVKAAVIERYLKSSFPYSKDVSTLPKDREFVDYFLFEEKKRIL
ncbi:hypothetical protein [Thermobrachium celere]|uniref:hypothetical protein n=1 Tax=Thermobrachium celere TaxID=53422 RepID=UPI0019427089|nr:hypothetical protein [Thermobrachium celere]GFR35475.1 hypothetical protein TCEA9_12870 [Thermobrachium celere]